MARGRVQSCITQLPDSLQEVAVQYHMGDLDCRVHRLAKTGLPERIRGLVHGTRAVVEETDLRGDPCFSCQLLQGKVAEQGRARVL